MPERKQSGVDEPDEYDLPEDDGICKECDGTGEHYGQLCKSCGGKGYLTA